MPQRFRPREEQLRRYSVANGSATGVSIGFANSILWNPSGTITLFVVLLRMGTNSSMSGVTSRLSRISADGAGGTVYTPVNNNAWDKAVTPPSGAFVRQAPTT